MPKQIGYYAQFKGKLRSDSFLNKEKNLSTRKYIDELLITGIITFPRVDL